MTRVRQAPRVVLSLALAGASLSPAGCSTAAQGPSSVSASRSERPTAFELSTLDGGRLASDTTRGRRTVLVFLTTYDLPSQVLVRELSRLHRTVEPRINVGIVVLEPPRNAPLAEAFATSLEIPFPVALADAETLGGRGPFGELRAVPTIVVLTPQGVVAYRHEGAVSAERLRRALQDAGP